MKRILNLWFGFSQTVTRRTYIVSGLSLMVLKYVVDSLIFFFAGPGRILDPLQYLNPSLSYRISVLTASGDGFSSVVDSTDNGSWLILSIAWTLPFIWIGVNMSVRRVIDAGMSKWLGLLFFVPVINFLFMIVMSCLPSAPKSSIEATTVEYDEQLHRYRCFYAVSLTVLVGLAMIVPAYLV